MDERPGQGASLRGTAGAAPLVELKALVRALPDLVWLKDADGVYLTCNARFESFVGRPEREIVGRSDVELFAPELAAHFRERDRAAIEADGPTVNEEEVAFASDGHCELLETVKTPLRDAAGRLVGVLGIARDITDRKRAEELLRLQSGVLGEIAAGAPLERTLDLLARGVEELSPGVFAAILVLDAGRGRLRHGAAPSLPEAWTSALDGISVAEGAGACGTAAFRRAPVISEDVTVDPLWAPFREQAVESGIRSAWAAPILASDRSLLGTFALFRRVPGRPTHGQLQVIALAADLGAIALGRDREERALRESEARYRLIAENSSDVIWLYDVALDRFTFVSPSVEKLRGFTVEEVLGQSMREALTPESYRLVAEGLPAALSDLAARGRAARARTSEVWQTRKDGSIVPTEVVTTFITDAEGRVTHIQGVSRDISERKRSEAALDEQDLLLRDVSATAHIGGWAFDPATGKGTWTDEVARIHDVDPAADTSAPFGLSFYEGESRERIERAVAQAVANGTPYDLDLELVSAKGARKTVRTVGLPVVRDGKVVQVRGTIQDVSAHARSEALRRETEEKLRLFIENAPAAIAMLDREMRYIFVSRRWLQDFRLGDRDLVGVSHYEVFPGIDERLREVHRRCLAGATERCDEDPFTRPDGAVSWLKWEARPWYDAKGRVGGLLIMSEDITSRRLAEIGRSRLQEQLQQAQKMESVGRLAGGIAHDFNNMLAVIEGHAALALEAVGEEGPVRRDLLEIRRAAERSAALTRQLLAFARRQAAAPRVLDLNATLEAMRGMLGRLIGEDVELSFRPGEGLWPVRIDPVQVDQLLANLCVNARDAIEGVGHVVVETRNVTRDDGEDLSRSGSRPGEFVVLSVADDGSGMSAEVKDHLFEPFFTTKEQGRGTGLGLATVYGIVRQNDGFLEVDSTPGEGTTFRIFLPRFEGELVEPAPEAPRETPRGSGETVLVVEDEEAILTLAASMLEQLGYVPLCASSPSEALELLARRRGEVRAVLTDVVMPVMNGRELVERARALAPGLPSLFMSGYTADVIADRGLLEEGFRLLQKPFQPHDLGVALKDAITGAPPRGPVTGSFAAPAPAPAPAQPPPRRLLFVDDDEALVELMGRALGRLGYHVAPFLDAQRALDAFAREPDAFDAVVTDAGMPGMGGLELTRRALAVRPGVPVVVVTGFVSDRIEAEASAGGARAVLLKGSTLDEYARGLDATLRGLGAGGPEAPPSGRPRRGA